MTEQNEPTVVQFAESPSALVAIAHAAHQVKDRDLERVARRQLAEQHGIVLSFKRRQTGGKDQP